MEAFQDAMQGLEDRFNSEEFEGRLERLRELDFSAIQERMEEVEERLRTLERELELAERLRALEEERGKTQKQKF